MLDHSPALRLLARPIAFARMISLRRTPPWHSPRSREASRRHCEALTLPGAKGRAYILDLNSDRYNHLVQSYRLRLAARSL